MGKKDKKPELKVVVVEYKVSMHCNACERSVVRILNKIEGIETYSTEMAKHKVVVTGKIDPEKVMKKLKKKMKKKVEIIINKEDGVEEEEKECNSENEDPTSMKMVSQLAVDPLLFDCYTESRMFLMFSDENPNACFIM
ncbi:hypothetical protein ACFE04_005647 [Oxalis oulophora]